MSLARLTTLIAALALASAPLVAAQQVELHLRSGGVVKGDLVSEDRDQVVVKSTSIGKSGKAMSMTMPYKRADIAELIPLGDPEVAYKTKSAAAASAGEQVALAQWCRDQGMAERAAEHAKKALALDATQEGATTLLGDLGWEQREGKWQKRAEAPKAATPPKDAAAKAAEEQAESIAAIDRQLAELQKRSTQLDTSLAKANSDLAAVQGLAQQVIDAKARLDDAERELAAIRKKNNSNDNGSGHPTGERFGAANIEQFTLAVDNAKKALAEARQKAGTSEAQFAQAKAKVSSLTDDKKKLDKKREELTARRETLAKAGGQPAK